MKIKPLLQVVSNSENSSYSICNFRMQYFTYPWHYHPELELTYIVEGRGWRYVGDHVTTFESGDLVLLGENLPHYWKSDQENGTPASEVTAIQFDKILFGSSFFNLPEMKKVKSLLQRASRGIHFKQDPYIIELINKILKAEGDKKLLHLLNILIELSNKKDYIPLASPNYWDQIRNTKDDRINKSLRYIMERFKEPITLKEVAQECNLSPEAFSRLFKTSFGKPFIQHLNEYRIGYASKQLLETNLNISEIAFESGYQNLSTFNKQFLKIKHKSPKQFREQYSFDKKGY